MIQSRSKVCADIPGVQYRQRLAKMIQEEDMGRLIRFIAESPAHIVLNEIVVSPTWNRTYLGGSDLKRG